MQQSIDFQCPKCGETLSVPSPDLYSCSNCGQNVNVLPRAQVAQPKAKKKTVSSFLGSGCIIQGIGLLLLIAAFFFGLAFPLLFLPIMLVGIVLIIYGSRVAISLKCSACGNNVEKTSKICPTCKSHF